MTLPKTISRTEKEIVRKIRSENDFFGVICADLIQIETVTKIKDNLIPKVEE